MKTVRVIVVPRDAVRGKLDQWRPLKLALKDKVVGVFQMNALELGVVVERQK